jgi:hypothetical protein
MNQALARANIEGVFKLLLGQKEYYGSEGTTKKFNEVPSRYS